MGEKKNPQFSETGIPHLVEKEFPHPVESEIPHLHALLVAPLSSMDWIWLLTLLPLLDSVGFAIKMIDNMSRSPA